MSPNTSQYVHHWLVYECNSKIQFNETNIPAPGLCFSLTENDYAPPSWESVQPNCEKISLAWAIGADLVQDFPSNIAYPLGGPQADFKYFYIQMHYNNPSIIKSKFNYKS